MRAKSELDTEEVLRLQRESVDDLDCPTPIVNIVPPRLALGSQGTTRIRTTRPHPTNNVTTRIVSEAEMKRAARDSMHGVVRDEVFDVEPATTIDASDPFEQVSTIEHNTAAVERTTHIEKATAPLRLAARGSASPIAKPSRVVEATKPSRVVEAVKPARIEVAKPARIEVAKPARIVEIAKAERMADAAKPVRIEFRPQAEVQLLPIVQPAPFVPRQQHIARVEVPRVDHVAQVEYIPQLDVIPLSVVKRFAPRVEIAPLLPPSAPVHEPPRRWLLGIVLTLAVGGIAMGATFLIARDFGRDASASASNEVAPAAPAASPTPAPVQEVSETKTLPVIPAEPTAGTLRFTVEPVDAKIRIDHVLYSSSTIELPIGPHEVEVTRRGYARWKRTLEVTATSSDVFVALAHTPRKRRVVVVRPSVEVPAKREKSQPVEVEKPAPVVVGEPTASEVVQHDVAGSATPVSDEENPLLDMGHR